MHVIGNYFYDNRKNIFYDKHLSEEQIDIINKNLPDDDLYEEGNNFLNNSDFENLDTKDYLPTDAGLFLTYNCQLRCTYCSYSSSEGSEYNLTEKDVEIFIDYLIKNVTIRSLFKKTPKKLKITITGGGEPTYSWSFFKNIISLIKNKCENNKIVCSIDITTNGMLNEEQINFICENVSSVMLSYDGTSKFQNKNRFTNSNQNSSEIVERTIKILDNNKKMPWTIRSTVWHDDFEHLREIADNLYGNYNNFNGWSISPILPYGKAIDKNIKDKQDFVKYYVDVTDYVANKYQKFNVSSTLLNNTLLDGMLYCGSTLFKHPWLLPNKNIVTCTETTHTQPCLGRISNGKVELHDNYQDKLMMICKDVYKSCRENCIVFRFCKGGCPMRFFGDRIPEPKELGWECVTRQNFIKYVLENILKNKKGFNYLLEQIELDELKNINIYKLRGVKNEITV